MKFKVLGLIPARGGSKRIPKKNIYPVLGKPLIYYIIHTAKKAKSLDKLIVSTDSQEVAHIAKSYGVEVPFLRPKKLAQDNTADLPVFQHALAELEKKGEKFDIVVNLRPTAVLLKPNDIDKVIDLLIKKNADSVRSVHEANQPPYWMKVINSKDWLKPFLTGLDEHRYPTRQLLPQKVYQLNAQVDAMKSFWIKRGKLYGNKILPYVMAETRVVDIDSPCHIHMVEAMLKETKLKP